jgi:hypothetical protein
MEATLSIKPVAEKQVRQLKEMIDLFVAELPSRIALEGCSVSYSAEPKPAAKPAPEPEKETKGAKSRAKAKKA